MTGWNEESSEGLFLVHLDRGEEREREGGIVDFIVEGNNTAT